MNKSVLEFSAVRKSSVRVQKNASAKLKSLGMRFKKHWKRWILIIVGLGILFFIFKKVTAEPSGITSTSVSRGTIIAGYTANGKVKAHKTADMKFNAPGKVSWINVKEGDKVFAYKGLAGLDAVQLNAAYQNSRNNYRDAQATADMILDSVKDHAKDESFTQKATRTTAEVARDNTYNLTLAAANALQNSMLVAPFSGTIVDTNGILPGMTLSASDLESKYIRIVDFGSIYFASQVDEIDYSKVKTGQEVEVNLDAFPGESCQGKVTKIGKNGEETAGGVITIPVDVELSGCKLDLVVNLNGQAVFASQKKENVLVVPKKYLVTKDGQDFVWKQTGTSIRDRKLIPVKVGLTSSTEAEIVEGLGDGDTIIYIPS